MCKFIKLTNKIINTNCIHHIDIRNNKFIIHLMANDLSGLFLFGMGKFKHEVCKREDYIDYKIIRDFIGDLK